MKFSHTFIIDQADIDELGHVNNVAYVRWMQDVAVAHWNDAVDDEHKERYFWVVVRHEVDYKKPAFVNDEIVAHTWVGEWTAVTCERFTEIKRGDEILMSGRTLWCMFHREANRPAKIGKDLKDRFI